MLGLDSDMYVIFVKEDCLHIQNAEYIEDGWYIKCQDGLACVYEIQEGGGEEAFIEEFSCLIDAIKFAEALT